MANVFTSDSSHLYYLFGVDMNRQFYVEKWNLGTYLYPF